MCDNCTNLYTWYEIYEILINSAVFCQMNFLKEIDEIKKFKENNLKKLKNYPNHLKILLKNCDKNSKKLNFV